VLSGILIAGCTGASGNSEQDNNASLPATHGGSIAKLVVGTTMAPSDINLADSDFNYLKTVMTNEGLVRIALNGSYIPGLAESWETSDSKTWTFHLVKNATWHDGAPVTSADVNYTWTTLYQQTGLMSKSHYGQIASILTPDEHTVVITLAKPNSNYLSSIQVMRIVPMHIFANVTDPKNYNGADAAVGCGPYEFTGFDRQAGVLTFKAYDSYYGGKPSVDSIEVRTFKNQDTMIMALKKGEIDTVYMWSAGISYFYMPGLLQDQDMKFILINNTAIPNALWFNNNKTPYNNEKFREAVSYAIDYDEIRNLIVAGYGSAPNAGFLPVGSYGYVDTRLLTLNVNKSKDLLDSIGYKDVNGDGFRESPDGKKFQPEILCRSDTQDGPRIADLLKKYMNSAGLDAKIKFVNNNDIITNQKTQDMAVTGTTMVGMTMFAGYGTHYFDNRAVGYAVVNDRNFTVICDNLYNATSSDQNLALGSDVQQYYASQLPAIALYWNYNIQPYNEKFEGWAVSPVYGILCYETYYGLHET
jgi:peptide/nickel transport system substrate-binding protein